MWWAPVDPSRHRMALYPRIDPPGRGAAAVADRSACRRGPTSSTPRTVARLPEFTGPSVADEFCATTSWSQVLGPHGWRCASGDPDGDDAVWLHPRATSMRSASVRSGCLFVFSTNTPFNVTESGNPNGYTKFRAYAVLEHGGDMSAAARALRGIT